jgi:hypothetical protein
VQIFAQGTGRSNTEENKMITNIISPMRNEKYTLEEVLHKGIERSSLRLDSWEFTKLHECFYHSIDGVIRVENFGVSDSIWNQSVRFQIDGSIPVHFTEGRKMSIGFGCGVDKSYHGQFPGQAIPENPEWDKYQNKTDFGIIKIYTETEEQTISLTEAIQDKKAREILAVILQRKIAEGSILGYWENTP